jgi:hypothetical protein
VPSPGLKRGLGLARFDHRIHPSRYESPQCSASGFRSPIRSPRRAGRLPSLRGFCFYATEVLSGVKAVRKAASRSARRVPKMRYRSEVVLGGRVRFSRATPARAHAGPSECLA